MSVRMKLSHSKTASRRAHHRTGTPRVVATPSGVRRRHFMDPATGMYRGKQIIAVGEAHPVEVTPKKKAVKKAVAKKKATTESK